MDLRKIKRLIEMIERSQIDEIVLSNADETIKIRKSASVAGQKVGVPRVYNVPESGQLADQDVDESKKVLSPMVGTFYRSSSPDNPPFVEVGQKVKAGQILCVIEAMKLMNEIVAERDGVISEILVKNAAPVEFGETLFILD